MSPDINSLAWVRPLDWVQRCAEANPGVCATAEIGNWRLTYRIAYDGWPIIKIYHVASLREDLDENVS